MGCHSYHPDKNAGDATAQDMFIKVAKAHEVLTDEATRENYEKYGNPDGYHGTSVTIGLPSWLTNKENELAILVAEVEAEQTQPQNLADAARPARRRLRVDALAPTRAVPDDVPLLRRGFAVEHVHGAHLRGGEPLVEAHELLHAVLRGAL